MPVETETTEKTTGTLLRPAHEVLLHAAQAVLEAHAMMPDQKFFDKRIEDGEVTPKEMNAVREQSKKLEEAIDHLNLQTTARLEDFIPEDHLGEVIAVCLEAAYTAWSRWGSEIQKFFTNHGTSYEMIRNFLSTKKDADDWRVLEECDDGSPCIEMISCNKSSRGITVIIARPFPFFFE